MIGQGVKMLGNNITKKCNLKRRSLTIYLSRNYRYLNLYISLHMYLYLLYP